MALADYYARNALAASQVLRGFDEQRIRAVLSRQRVGLSLGADAANCAEGRALIDLLTRLLARLYPTLVIRAGKEGCEAADDARALALSINPAIEFSRDPTVEIVIGAAELPSAGGGPRIFVGSKGWNALVSITGAKGVGNSVNPFGAGAAACLGAANLFRWVFQANEACFDREVSFSVLEGNSGEGGDADLDGSIGEIVMVGAGAIGNGAAWAFTRTSMDGILHIVDHETVELSNLQRYVLAARDHEGKQKSEVLSRNLDGRIAAVAHLQEFSEFISSHGYLWPGMLLALDSAGARRAAQASLPMWIANSWTQPNGLGVSSHDFLSGACVACLYLPQHSLLSEDAIISSTFGVPDRLMQIRVLLFNKEGVPRDLLDGISTARSIPIELLLPFEGRPVRTLYTEGFCGGAVIPLGAAGEPRQEVHVPLAHQSALAGLLLAAAAVRKALGFDRRGTQVTRIDVMRPLGVLLTQPAAKDSRGICICQDRDYQEIYRRKYL